ncbi:Putative N-acetylgalactosaminyl-diphosphoundecaprenol glucuronosyltransferase [hydrothermal vent metagenome]|uniref:Putative N-acetylgalactosaminyl-diphosphoundecaprenol glucuronosyltransferase n=1 Tax=hydrothermal vent metagenome TaxID=652676 RepID=A0A1W1CY48_9ZZZZ
MEITVVIPTYNRYEFLKRAVASVIAQTHSVDEIIVVDDGSSDATAEIIKDFPSITYIYQKNRGVSAARNRGIERAKNEWIAFLDSDDAWHPTKIAEQVQLHQDNNDILMSYTDERWIRNGKEVKVPKKYAKVSGEIFQACLSHCIIAPSATLLHNSLFQKYGIFDEELEVCEDYDLWLRIALYERVGLVEKKLITKYAGHPEQLSFKHWGMDRFRTQALEKLLLQVQNAPEKEELVRQELLKKYLLLLKGARKYDKMADIKFYEKRVENLQ